jgi:hypothetical protein
VHGDGVACQHCSELFTTSRFGSFPAQSSIAAKNVPRYTGCKCITKLFPFLVRAKRRTNMEDFCSVDSTVLALIIEPFGHVLSPILAPLGVLNGPMQVGNQPTKFQCDQNTLKQQSMLINSKKCSGAIISVVRYLPPLRYGGAYGDRSNGVPRQNVHENEQKGEVNV